jgi:hypothetical protein
VRAQLNAELAKTSKKGPVQTKEAEALKSGPIASPARLNDAA